MNAHSGVGQKQRHNDGSLDGINTSITSPRKALGLEMEALDLWGHSCH